MIHCSRLCSTNSLWTGLSNKRQFPETMCLLSKVVVFPTALSYPSNTERDEVSLSTIVLTSGLKSCSVSRSLLPSPPPSRGSPGGGHLRPEYTRAQGESQSTTTAQLQSQLQQHFAELAAKIPLPDLLGRVRNLGFPSSCNFVLNMLERYVHNNGEEGSTIL